ncbi:MAG: LacI family DNA-binding transcriptional regulator [Candidatus Sumerlaeia bacterium]
MTAKRPTIRDIATRTGFSKSTVSAALAGDPRVKEETRRFIKEIAESMGYRPHPHFRLLGAQRKRGIRAHGDTIAFLLSADDLERRPRFQAARDQAEAMGYNTELIPIDENTDYLELADRLYHRGIRGLLVVWGCQFRAPKNFPWDRFACVATGYRTGLPYIDRIRHDPFLAVLTAWKKMHDAGWRRIGGYFPYDDPAPCYQDVQRVSAFEYYQRRDCAPHEIVPPLQCRFNDIPPFRTWFEKHQPEALIGVVSSPVSDPRFLDGLVDSPPPFVGLQVNRKQLSTAGIDVHSAEVQRSAIIWLEEKMRLGQFGFSMPVKSMLIEPEWIEGQSLWKKPQKADKKVHATY